MYFSSFTAAGHKFGLAEWEGNPERTIVGIHGLTGNHVHMMALAEALTPAFRFAAYDVRGRGDSDPADSPSNLMKHARDAVALIEALGLKKCLLVGHSMGGLIGALAAGLSERIAGLVLLDGGGRVTQQEIDALEPAMARLDKLFPSVEAYVTGVKPGYVAMGLPWNPFIDAAVRHEIGLWTGKRGGDGEQYRYKGDSARIREDLLSSITYDQEAVFAAINCPVMLVYASGNMGARPLFQEESTYAIVRKMIPELDYFKSPANHYTLVLERQPELKKRIEMFAARCGF